MPISAGLLGLQGLAEGLKSGLLTYQQQKQYQDEKDLKKQYLAAHLAENNLLQDPTGAIQPTPFLQKKQEAEMAGYGTQIAENDPNVLKQTADIQKGILSKHGVNIPEGTLGPAVNKVVPTAEKFATIDASKNKLDFATEYRNNNRLDKMTENLKNDLDPNKARAGNFADISKRYLGMQRLKTLMTDAKGNVANLPHQQMEEAVLGMASVLAPGGQPSEGIVKNLLPDTAVGSGQKFLSWFLNKPEGAAQQAFTKLYLETINRESDLAEKQLKEIQTQRLSAHSSLKKMDPDRYKSVLQAYGLDEDSKKGLMQAPPQTAPANGLIAPQKLPAHPMDAEAIQYAKENPNDPMSAQILKANGM